MILQYRSFIESLHTCIWKRVLLLSLSKTFQVLLKIYTHIQAKLSLNDVIFSSLERTRKQECWHINVCKPWTHDLYFFPVSCPNEQEPFICREGRCFRKLEFCFNNFDCRRLENEMHACEILHLIRKKYKHLNQNTTIHKFQKTWNASVS